MIDQRQRMAHKGLNDVKLVLDAGNGDRPHGCHLLPSGERAVNHSGHRPSSRRHTLPILLKSVQRAGKSEKIPTIGDAAACFLYCL
jgi:hypothetical protein